MNGKMKSKNEDITSTLNPYETTETTVECNDRPLYSIIKGAVIGGTVGFMTAVAVTIFDSQLNLGNFDMLLNSISDSPMTQMMLYLAPFYGASAGSFINYSHNQDKRRQKEINEQFNEIENGRK